MNPPKVTDEDYINFIIAAPREVTATEAERVQPESTDAPAHDAFTRLLTRLEPDPETLWKEAQTQIDFAGGILVLDDSTLEKPFSKFNALVYRQRPEQTKSGRRRHQPDHFALDGRRAVRAGRLSRL